MAKSRKKSTRSKKTAGKAKSKARKKTPGQARVKGRPAARPRVPRATTYDVTTDPTVVFACVDGVPKYPGAPAGLWERIAEIQEFQGVVPRGQITITVTPEEEV